MGSFPETYNNPHEECLGVWLLPSGRDFSHRGTPQQCMFHRHPFIHLGKRDGRGMSLGLPDSEFEVLTARPHASPL